MHIPDGFLDPRLCLATGGVSAAAVGAALRRLRPESEPGLVPRMGLTAAYVFAAQMINFPVAAGTSGHLLGGLLTAVLLGPHAACVVMASVFLIQTFFFLDGGHTALGANVLNMGLAGTYGGYAVYRAIAGPNPGRGRLLLGAGVAAWLAVMMGAALTSAELALSGTIAGRLVFPAMLGVHALIGLGEAAITIAALGLLWQVRPDLLTGKEGSIALGSRLGWGLLAGLVAVAALAPLASEFPDGLEKVAEGLGFHGHAADPSVPGPMPDYSLPGLGGAGGAAVLVSLTGAALMGAALWAMSRAGKALPEGTGKAVLGRLDARVKLGMMLALVLTAVLLPAHDAGKVVLVASAALLWVLLARVSLGWLLSRALLLLPFVGFAALSLARTRGIDFYGLVFLRAGASLLATAVLAATTPEPRMLAAMTAYRMPRAFTETVAFALRYLRLLREEAGRMLQARAARTLGGGTLALRASVAGAMVGSLFIRSFERAERISLAMAARGYRTDMERGPAEPIPVQDWMVAAGMAVFLMGVWLWR